MVKIFRSISTQLDNEEYSKLLQICKEQGYKPYYILKDLLHQFIESYEFAFKEDLEKEKQEEYLNDSGLAESNDS